MTTTGVDSDDTNAFGVLIGMPFQLAAMALLGSLHLSEDGFDASLFLPPLFLTALYRRDDGTRCPSQRARPGGRNPGPARVGVGFVAAVVLTPLTWALAMRTEGTSVHAASVCALLRRVGS